MPVGVDKVYPLLRAIASCGTVKEVVGTGEGLVKQADEVVLHGGLQLHVIPELPIQCFQLAS